MDNGYNPNCASCRVLLLGDNRVGKTALATQYVDEVFLSDYIPTRIETMTRREMVNGQMFVIDVFDCTSRSDYVAQRSQYIEMADVVLFVYNVLSRDSLMHLREYAKEVSNVRQKMIPKPDLQRSPRLPKDSVNDSRSPTPSSSTTSSSALARRQIPMFLVGTHTDEIKQRRRQVSTSDAEKMTEECMESMGLELSAGATIASTKSEVKKQSGILERLWKSMWSSAEDQDRQSSDVEGVEVPNGASRRLPLFELSVKNLSDVMDLFHAVIRLHMLVNGGGGSSGARRRRSLQHGGIIRPFSNRVTARGQSQAVDQKLCLPMLPTLYNESLDTDEDSDAKSKNAVAFVDNSNVNPAKPTTFAVPSNTQLRLSERIPIVRAYALSEDTKPLGDSGRTRSQSPDFRPASILKRGTPPHHRSATASGFRRSAIPPAPPAPRRNSAAPSRADLARPAAEVETRINPALLADAVRPSSPPPRVTHAPRTTTTAPAPAPAPAQAAQARPTHSNAQANGVSTQASSRPTSHPNPSTTTLPVPHPPPANHPLNIQRTAAAASRPQEQAFQDPLVFSAPAPMRGPRYATQYGRMPIVLSPMNLSDEPATLDRPPSDHITRDTQPARSRQDDGSGQCCCCVM